MLALNWRLSLVIFAVVPPIAWAMRSFGADRAQAVAVDPGPAGGHDGDRRGGHLGRPRGQGVRARAPTRSARYGDAVEDLFETARRRAWIVAAFWSSVGFGFSVALVVIFWFGGREVLADRLTAGALVAFIVYALNIARSVAGAGRLYTSFQSAAGASDRLFELLDSAPEIVDAPGARPLATVARRGRARRRHVRLRRRPADPARRLARAPRPARPVALVGPSGAGKTTLLHLIPRFYDPDAGTLRIDGVDVRDATVESVRDVVALVAQDVQLFGVSLRDNIRYGRLDATDAEVEAAARAAHAADFIEALPDGYDTPVGERGIKLSGGQRQRIAIARALLKDPPILLLDEATSALDAASEAAVQDALAELMQGRTSFVIAHRLATVRDADRIVVLDAGRVVEEGHARRAGGGRRPVRRPGRAPVHGHARPGAGRHRGHVMTPSPWPPRASGRPVRAVPGAVPRWARSRTAHAPST